MADGLRFGFQLTSANEKNPIKAARRAEELGFDVVLVGDHVGHGAAPLPILAIIAAATESIRLGTLVLNNDMRNPVQLAWEMSSLDRLSSGRIELGLGAGHTPQEYLATGIGFDAAAKRKGRLIEAVQIIRRLLDGEVVYFEGEHYHVAGAQIKRSLQEHLPILVAGNGERLLRSAGLHADMFGFQGLGKTREDGYRHAVKWDPDWLTKQVEQLRSGAGDRFEQIELNALVQIVEITDDREQALQRICDEFVSPLSPEQAGEIPYVLVGSVKEIAEHILRCRDRWGISYFVVRELEAFSPVLAALR